jgi:hypothetical protein
MKPGIYVRHKKLGMIGVVIDYGDRRVGSCYVLYLNGARYRTFDSYLEPIGEQEYLIASAAHALGLNRET